jgi:hypothetical protein
MAGVNSQREKGTKERKNGFRPGYGGQQLKSEKSFISRALAEGPVPERQSLPSVVGGGDGIRTHDTVYHRITV